ncbi:hypothetical protein MMC28_006710 [Mycoblastus sanguinarius]|nr:hypothetical protein [Mycoblastus sanguinarius]
MDRDCLISTGKAACSGCEKAHDKSVFTDQALAEDATERYCRGLEGKFWVCPHKVFVLIPSSGGVFLFGRTSGVRRPSLPDDGIKIQFPIGERASVTFKLGVDPQNVPSSSAYKPCSDHFHANSFGTATVVQEVYITEADWNVPLDAETISACVKRLDMQICPHARLSHPIIIDILESKKRVPGLTFPYLLPWTCSHCSAHLTFDIESFDPTPPNDTPAGRTILRAFVQRPYPRFNNVDPTDPAWLAQISTPAEIALLTEEWNTASSQCLGDTANRGLLTLSD